MDPVNVEILFRDAADLFVLLGPDRRVRTMNPSFRRYVRAGRPGGDFLDMLPDASRSRLATDLARAAGGDSVKTDVIHEGGGLVEWRFFPVEGGLVGGVGRSRGEDPEMAEQLGRVNDELREKTRILDHIQIELTQVPFIDPVTGVWNRLQVVERLTGEWSRSERYASPISVLLAQVQGLHDVRAKHGAFVADEALKTVARRLKRTVRDHDVVGRYGDARFVLVAVADGDGARALGGRLRKAVEAEPIAVGERRVPIRLIVGGATNRSEGVEIMEDLFTVAEAALEDAEEAAVGIVIAPEPGD